METVTAKADYTVTNVTWNEGLTLGGKFKAGQVYTATVELTSKNGKEFQAAAFTPAVAGAVSVGTTTTVGTGVGNKVSFTVTYAATGALAVDSIAVKTQPTDLTYTAGEALNLSGIVATLTYNDTSTEDVAFGGFAAKGITASPINGTTMAVATHNNTSVTISCNGRTATTNRLTVTVDNSGRPSTSTSTQSDNKIDIIFQDETQKAATAKISEKDGVKTTAVILDDVAVKQNLDKMGNKDPNGDKANTIIIPVNNNSDIVIGQLNGQTVKNMQDKNATLEIKTENVIYTIPAEDINIDNVLDKIGSHVQLKDITVKIAISKSSKETMTKVEDSARINNLQVVVNPVDFEITCTDGSKTVIVSKFNNYVERTVILPDGINSKKITTCVVLNDDGTFSHVPTAVRLVDGKYYAKINSLTNSTYALIWNPVTFKDVEKHWARNNVNSVGSRLIDEGVGNSNFDPNRAITRAEFASMIVKALGLKGTNLQEEFKDVKKSDPNYYYICTAYEYGIMDRYSNGKFGPQDLVTKEQAMTMLVKAMDIAAMDLIISDSDVSKQLQRFKDSSKISKYARQNAAICVKYGIFKGDKKERLNPKGNLTRAESATVIMRLLKKAKLI